MKTVRDGWSSGRAEPVPRAPRVRSAVRVTVIALTVGLIAGPFAPVGSASACASLEPKDWVTIPVPDFPAGNQVIADLDVSYTDPSLLFVTNGYSVLSSTDGGCSFREAFNLASFEADFDVATAAIADLHLASNDGRRVYLAVKALERVKKPELPDLGLGDLPPVDLPMEKPHVIVSSDGGQSWTLSDTGLEDAYGPPLSIVSTPDSESAYLLVDQGEVKTDAGPRIFTPQKLYASTSGGSSWAEMQVFGDPAGVDANGDDAEDGRLYAGLESDPADPKTLWAFGPNGLQKSIDGGASFVPPSFADALSSLTGVSGVETYRGPKGPTEVLAFPTGQSLVLYSNNGGTTFVAHPEPGPIESAALADGVRFAAATTTGEAYYHFPTVGEPIDISLQGSISGLEAVLSGEKDLIYGHTVNAVVRRVAPDPPPGPVWEFPLPEVFDSDSGPFPDIDDHCKLPPALLLPADREVVLEPGESETLSYRTAIPGVIQADVAFLSDVSGSMAEEIAGLKNSMEGIVLALDEAGICLWGGVAQYRDYSSSLPYQRLSDIQPPGSDAFKDAFGQLIAGGGEDQT
ncbi:MAG: WD40/YVTN/BNR-like repeat-containing protein, partial [Actinomycetota bacterium]